VDDGDGEVASPPVPAEVLASADPLVLPDALVSAGTPAPELGSGLMDGVFCIASILLCLTARSSSILFSLLALSCELSGGAKPGGLLLKAGHTKSRPFSELAIEHRLESWPHVQLLFLLGQCLLSFV
jgi:hypothetical protein